MDGVGHGLRSTACAAVAALALGHAAGATAASDGASDSRLAHVAAAVEGEIAAGHVPGAVVIVGRQGRVVYRKAFGARALLPARAPMTPDTIFDLASLTKPIATTSMAMLLFGRGQLSLDSPVADYLHAFAETGSDDAADVAEDEEQRSWRKQVTVATLLAHSSGLPAHRKLYLQVQGREAMLEAARRLPLDARPGTRAEYSDMGFIVLGELLEHLTGERLDQVCRREVFAPLNLNLKFSPPQSERKDIPPTVNDLVYRHRIVQGEVNDENASAMGGVAGHAGLFGDALSVARFAECLLPPQQANRGLPPQQAKNGLAGDPGLAGGPKVRGATPIFRPETVALFTARQAAPAGTSRTLGWDTPSPPSQSGSMFSPRSFGHLGYTGTSLWCDPERQLSVTLLTNRTWPDSRNQAIKVVRPQVHDAIFRVLASHG